MYAPRTKILPGQNNEAPMSPGGPGAHRKAGLCYTIRVRGARYRPFYHGSQEGLRGLRPQVDPEILRFVEA